MQKADVVLSMLRLKSEHDPNFIFDRIYRNLFNEDFYIRAYQKIQANQGNMTPGTDGQTIDGFSKNTIHELIDLLKKEQYHPRPVRRAYIPKKNGKVRPLGIPSFRDKLVQEVIRQLLEAVYEPIFLETSHGFRPNKSCHTALYYIQGTARGTNWVIEGDIKGCFDHINHAILLKILERRIKDGRLLELIRRFLEAGYLEFKQVYNTISGTPQGGIISPILANIYLHEFDVFMKEIAKSYTKGRTKRSNPEYHRLNCKRSLAQKHGNADTAAQCLQLMQQMPAHDPMDPNFIRVKYVRYADDFLVCIIGSKQIAAEIKQKISTFMKEHLDLELSMEKTAITNLADNKVKFLGYEITKAHCDSKMTVDTAGRKKRSINGAIQLLVPRDVINAKLRSFCQDGKAAAFRARTSLPIADIISLYNAEIRGLYNYYCLASNVSRRLATFMYYHYYSMVKTIALKEKSTVAQVISKYGIDIPRKQGNGTRKIVGFTYRTQKGPRTMTYFCESIRKVEKPLTDLKDTFGQTYGGQLIKRLNANRCEICGSTQGNMEVHHVRKLKDVVKKYRKRGATPPYWVLQMAYIRRKTLIVCKDCHNNIHAGRA